MVSIIAILVISKSIKSKRVLSLDIGNRYLEIKI